MRRFWAESGRGLVSKMEREGLLRWTENRDDAVLAALHESIFRAMMEELRGDGKAASHKTANTVDDSITQTIAHEKAEEDELK